MFRMRAETKNAIVDITVPTNSERERQDIIGQCRPETMVWCKRQLE